RSPTWVLSTTIRSPVFACTANLPSQRSASLVNRVRSRGQPACSGREGALRSPHPFPPRHYAPAAGWPTQGVVMQRSDLPVPTAGILATHCVVAQDIEATAGFYSEVLGGEVVLDGTTIGPGAPTYVKFANLWIIINSGGGPTRDKPEIVLA